MIPSQPTIPSEGPYSQVDLLSDQVQPQDFEEGGLAVLFKRNETVIVRCKDPKHYRRVSANAMTKAINRIAEDQIDRALSPKKEKGKPLNERIADVAHRKSRLLTLKKNLQVHSEVLKAQHHKLSFLGKACAVDHLRMERQIDTAIKALANREQMLTQTLKKRIEAELSQLETCTGEGLIIDQPYMLLQSPALAKQIAALPSESAKHYIVQHQEILNRAYISQLIDQVKQGQAPITESSKIVLESLGYSEAEILKALQTGKEELLFALNKHLEDPHLKEVHPSTLLKTTQDDIFQMFGKALMPGNAEANQRIEDILKISREVEQTLEQHQYQFAQLAIKNACRKIDQEGGSKKWRDARKGMVAQTALRNDIPEVLKVWLQSKLSEMVQTHGIGLKKITEPDSSKLEAYLKRVLIDASSEDILTAMRTQTGGLFEKARERSAQTAFADWLDRQTKLGHVRFKYQQTDWGNHAILGKGICKAVNLRWLMKQMESPEMAVRRASDLDRIGETSIAPTPRQSGLLTANDRFVQAAFNVARQRGELILPRFLLQKLGLEATSLKKEPSLEAMIERVLKAHEEGSIDLDRSAGLVEVVVSNKEAGHAIGMRIDTKRNRFAFFDVNSGFFEFSSLKAMQNAFQEYIELAYSGDLAWTGFEAIHYRRHRRQ